MLVDSSGSMTLTPEIRVLGDSGITCSTTSPRSCTQGAVCGAPCGTGYPQCPSGTTCSSGVCRCTNSLTCGNNGRCSDCGDLDCRETTSGTKCACPLGLDCISNRCTFVDGVSTHGDGSDEHKGCDMDGDGLFDDSRVFAAKGALRNVVGAFGEIEFALARFKQVTGGGSCSTYLDCPRGPDGSYLFDCLGPTGAKRCVSCISSCDSDTNYDECTASFSCGSCDYSSYCSAKRIDRTCEGDASPIASATVDCYAPSSDNECINYVGAYRTSDALTCVNAGGEVLVSFPASSNDDNFSQLSAWIDNHELGGTDKELRAIGPTPLGASLSDMKAFLTGNSLSPLRVDTSTPCRDYAVILLTDGEETCLGDPVAAARALRNIAVTRNDGARVTVDVKTYVIALAVCPPSNPNCPTKLQLDAIAAAGGTNAAHVVTSEAEISAAVADIVANSIKTEMCNELDDDCDKQVDEDFPEKGSLCTAGVGACARVGARVCRADGLGTECSAVPGPKSFEKCNNIDDDCNGLIDDGISCIPCSPQPEACNGRDDDCDSLVDEDIAVAACGIDVGACEPGHTECIAGRLVCLDARGPVPETCNNMDDDCDSIVDSFSAPCYDLPTGCNLSTRQCQGRCQLGLRTCTSGSFGACVGAVGPTTEIPCNKVDDDCDGETDEGAGSEVCDGFDNDCDGLIDESDPSVGKACGTPPFTSPCRAGTLACVGGALACQGERDPQPETCDKVDNDCDGVVDNGIAGLGGTCGTDEGECTRGTLRCIDGAVACAGALGPRTETCDCLDNDCDGQVDESDPLLGTACGDLPGGGSVNTEAGECQLGIRTCQAAPGCALACTGAVGPAAETCNGRDDDCDEKVDEDFTTLGTPCTNGMKGACRASGIYACSSDGQSVTCTAPAGTPSSESCNGIDDDCDGLVDEDPLPFVGTTCAPAVGACGAGKLACENGALRCVVPTGTDEVCDGKDNDCDGLTDESDPALGTQCGTPPFTSPCQAGTTACVSGRLACRGEKDPQAETCDGVDNDCDGTIDNGVPGFGVPCGTDEGECTPGVLRCVDGRATCVGAVGPKTETCDCLDNDCDGQLDESDPLLSTPCGDLPGGGTVSTDTGECQLGIRYCPGAPKCTLACKGAIGPAAEQCNGFDDDCDGSTDEDFPAVGKSCDNGMKGACLYTGTIVCNPTGTGTLCTAPLGTPGVESCNRIDDDCDGEVDEAPLPYVGGACTPPTGCTGTWECASGSLRCTPTATTATETCNGKDDDCDGLVDESDPELGQPCGTPPFTSPCKAGVKACVGGALACQGERDPLPEACDGVDNDCDGDIDEEVPGFGVPCETSVGECEPGVLGCVNGAATCVGGVGPKTEVCDCLDNDCDGLTDESDPMLGSACSELPDGTAVSSEVGECQHGIRVCPGVPRCALACKGAIGPARERCNGLDDDCDGKADEDFPTLGQPCENGMRGACAQAGTVVCAADGNGIACSAPEGTPGIESCNGIDDDCDGEVDEEPLPYVGTTCSPAIGICAPGLWECHDGALRCSSAGSGSAEICNGLDDDCDGLTDEPILPGTGEQCVDPGYEGIGDKGECEFGQVECIAGDLSCQGYRGPKEEVCNGKDDDCDGIPDDSATCPHPDEVCYRGSCVLPCCHPGEYPCEFPCPGGFQCVPVANTPEPSRYCASDPCTAITCGQGEYCDPSDASCKAYCTATTCAEGKTCLGKGECVDCFDPRLACPTGMLCARDEGGVARCTPDPCPKGRCADDEICKNGSCIPDCSDKCAAGERCDTDTGECVPDLCDRVTCETGDTCDPMTGECARGRCIGVSCPGGEICVPATGACVADPCLSLKCPTDPPQKCQVNFQGSATCVAEEDTKPGDVDLVLASGGGGCACDVGGSRRGTQAGGGLVLLVLAIACFRLRALLTRASRSAWVLLLFLTACNIDPFALSHARDAGAGLTDAQSRTDGRPKRPDAAGDPILPAPDACVPLAEACDSADNDCDGKVDEDFDLSSDPNHCGDCKTVCRYPHAFGTCRQGTCEKGQCVSGYHDLNGDPSDGCEYFCIPTAGGIEACDFADNDCDGEIDEGFDLATDTMNCGGCGQRCALPNATAACVDADGDGKGTCVVERCDPGAVDLNPDMPGCEYRCIPSNGGIEKCDGLDNDCNGAVDDGNPSGGLPCGTDEGACVAGKTECVGGILRCVGAVSPTPEKCNDIDDDCDSVVDDPIDKMTDVNHCGSCKPCALPFASPTCVGGACQVASCHFGHVDLDSKPENGCEYACIKTGDAELCDKADNDCDGLVDEDFDLSKDPMNCGSCGNTCTFANASAACTGNRCTMGKCAAGFQDLDGKADNGCEYACTPTGPEACNGADDDCDGAVDEGVNLAKDPVNCGGCGQKCELPHAVAACEDLDGDGLGSCVVASCEGGYVDVSPAVPGCEYACTPSQGGVEKCDNLDNDCDGTVDEGNPEGGVTCGTDEGTCVAGKTECVLGLLRCVGSIGPRPEICNDVDDNCDGVVDDPIDKSSDVNHCGSCKPCGLAYAIPTCVRGACQVSSCQFGHVDLDRKPENGCEYACIKTSDSELCDGKDNDCDGLVDEGFDMAADPLNCGSCGNACVYSNATGRCLIGRCSLGPCAPGYYDIDRQASSGCEYACTPTGSETCNGLDDDCDGTPDEGFDLATDVNHCGGCGQKCELLHAVARCVDPDGNRLGSCVAASCEAGYVDLNPTIPGCEYACTRTNGGVEACDGADNDCDGAIDEGNPGGGIACGTDEGACVAGKTECTYGVLRCVGEVGPAPETCNDIDDDCDKLVDDPIDKSSDVNHCGSCNPCKLPYATPKCVGGTCQVASCRVGRVDLDRTPENGCEYACIRTSSVELCDRQDNDCDGSVDEGFNLSTDPQNCGTCGNTCAYANAAATCLSGRCAMGSCLAGFVDLDGRTDNGCEYACTATGRETCNGIDDDCNGSVDDKVAEVGTSCGTDTGECAVGTRQCLSGVLTCVGAVGPSPEICDGKDNNCENGIDETFDKQNDPRYCGGCTPCEIPNAVSGCSRGQCTILACKSGFVDFDGKAPNGCEYACTVTGAEICDGLDNDCDTQVDEGLSAPAICASRGPCAGTIAKCMGASGWKCAYPSSVQVDPSGNLVLEETLCDGIDNDCDGGADEPFALKGTSCAEDGSYSMARKVGACRGTGVLACNATKDGLTCNITTSGATPTNELCNQKDDDCDGKVDEPYDYGGFLGVRDALVTIAAGGSLGTYVIYAYEASRPDATAASPGLVETRACSSAGRIPWPSASWNEAQAACQAAGLRLCKVYRSGCSGGCCNGPILADEWGRSCQGGGTPPGDFEYPYGDTYQPLSCNGSDYDPITSTASNEDLAIQAGSLLMCKSEGSVYDLSGNLKEWTDDPRCAAGSVVHTLRGGSFDNHSTGLTCDFQFTVAEPDFALANVGFRCCGQSCAPGQSYCGGTCVDLATSPAHCGACGNSCGSGVTCVNGTCCPSGTTSLCGGTCCAGTCDAGTCK
ncbi:MAG: SUMF1/EgtB/PvdO family nonheme iron enzyme [Deltaproteobacteria bacterium]|nr:SUMF1/EgtB/PvdO family nonheme iron enzyme [Deltaproteobacteria bacterium]